MSVEPTAGAPPPAARETAAGVDLGRSSRSGWRGRNREWRLLAGLLRAAEGSRGGVLLVEGQSGMGKSRLLNEAINMSAAQGFMLAHGAADEPSRLAPLKPLIDALGESLDTLRSGQGAVLSDAVDMRFWLLERLHVRLEERAARGPLLIALDDLQWADPTTLLALRSLIPQLVSYPVVWILSRTIGDGGGDVERLYDVLERDGAARIMLDALDDQAVAEVAADVLGAAPEPELLAFAAAAGGNPFLLVELVEGLRDESAIEITHGHARLISEGVPQRVQQRVHSRLRRLPQHTRRLLQVAAILGRSFRVDDLAVMLGQPASKLLQSLEEAEATGVVVASADTLTFRHDILWRAVLKTITVPVRQALHRQAAEMLLNRGGSAILAAAHLMYYARPGDAGALAGLDQAAHEVLATSPKTAADLAVRALELTTPSDPGRFDRTVNAIYALTTAGQLTEAADLARTSLSRITPPGQAAHLGYELAYILMLAGRPVEAVAEAEKALGQEDIPDQLRGLIEQVRFRSLWACHNYRRGRRRAEAVVATAEQQLQPALVGAHMLLGSTAWSEGRAADGIRHLREAVRAASDGPIQAQHAHPRLHLATLLTDMRQLDEAATVLEAASEEIAAYRHTAHASSPALHRARLRLAAGRFDDAVAEAQAALTIIDEVGVRAFIILGISVLTIVAVRRGDMDTAARYAEQYKSEYQAGHGAMYGKGWGNWAVALAAEAKDGPDKAIYERHPPFTDPGERRWLLMVEPSAAAWLTRTALAVSDHSAAVAIAETAECLAHDNPDFPTLAASAAQANGILHDNPTALTSATTIHVGPWDRASAAEDLGVVLARTAGDSDPDAAIHSLDRALNGYQQLGALRDVARVRGRLRKLGVRRRHGSHSERPLSGWDSLTDTERDVATLVAQGLTNRQVATQMFVSPHTINFHLRQVFRKLDIGTRVELARMAMERQTPPPGT